MGLIFGANPAAPRPYVHAGPALYLTADRSEVVEEGDERAAFLLVADGGTAPAEDVAKYQLHERAAAAAAKAKPARPNKSRGRPKNKSAAGEPDDDEPPAPDEGEPDEDEPDEGEPDEGEPA